MVSTIRPSFVLFHSVWGFVIAMGIAIAVSACSSGVPPSLGRPHWTNLQCQVDGGTVYAVGKARSAAAAEIAARSQLALCAMDEHVKAVKAAYTREPARGTSAIVAQVAAQAADIAGTEKVDGEHFVLVAIPKAGLAVDVKPSDAAPRPKPTNTEVTRRAPNDQRELAAKATPPAEPNPDPKAKPVQNPAEPQAKFEPPANSLDAWLRAAEGKNVGLGKLGEQRTRAQVKRVPLRQRSLAEAELDAREALEELVEKIDELDAAAEREERCVALALAPNKVPPGWCPLPLRLAP